MQGYILKRSETDYVIDCDSNGQGGYNVVSSNICPDLAYTLEDVRNYLLDNPDMLLNSAQIETDKLTRKVRTKRDTLLKEVVDSMNPMRWEALTKSQKQKWRDYRQALLDITKQKEFPCNILWPTEP